MATSQRTERLQEEATCSICMEYFTDPVCIECGHNFCRACITQCWQGPGVAPECPQCRTACPARGLRPNRELRNIVEVIKVGFTKADLCPRHQQRLLLYCETDRKPICVVCDKAKEHRGHTVIPIEEAAQEYKATLDNRIIQLKQEVEDVKKWTAEERKTSSILEETFKNQTEKIVVTFEQLQQFVENEKKKLLLQLEEEHEVNMKCTEERVSKLRKQLSTHRAIIAQIEVACKQRDVELLTDVQSTLSRCDSVNAQKPVDDVKVEHTLRRMENACLQDKLMELKDTFAAEVDRILAEFWPQIKKNECEVTLDLDTAYPWLVLSEDGRSVRFGDSAQDLPDTPERYDSVSCILGRERLSSGRHYWEVEVGEKPDWDLGVCDESESRKGAISASSVRGYWVVSLRDGGKYIASTSPWTPLTLHHPPKLVGLFLDYEAGRISFYNAQDGSLLYVFSGATFPCILRPFFRTGSNRSGKNAGVLRVTE